MARLSQLLQTPGLGLRLIQAGAHDPQLTWVSTTELLDLGEYLEGGEVVLTTGLSLERADPRWRDFVAGLSRARVAAIGFGVDVNHSGTPPALIAAASMYRVSLFEVPPLTPFIAVSKAVATLLQADELRAARRALQAQEQLLNHRGAPFDVTAVLARLAQSTGLQLAVTRDDGAILARTAGFERSDEPVEEIELSPSASWRLAVSGGEPLDPNARALLAAGALVLGLELSGLHEERERERDRWGRYTDAILDGSLPAAALRSIEPVCAPLDRVRAVAVVGDAERISDWRHAPHDRDRLLTGPTHPLGSGRSLAWFLCPAERADAAVDELVQHGLDAVVGREARLEDAALSQRSAAVKISSLTPKTSRSSITWVDRDAPFLDAALSVDTRAISAAVLGGLSPEHPSPDLADAERQDLVASLRAFLQHGGRRGPAAADLDIHRNTLRERLRKAANLTGRDLDDPDDRADLWLALRLEELQRPPRRN